MSISRLFVTVTLFVSANYPAGIDTLDHIMPVWLTGFFQSLGSIFFLPTVLPGIIFAVVILATSRILFMLAVGGYYSGTFLSAILTGSFIQAFSDINHFNFILIAMVVGGVFLVPSIRSYTLAIIAVLISTFFLAAVQVFWANYGIPGFTLPFNVVSLTFIYVLGLIGFPLMARYIRDTPEETLDDYIADTQRFKGNERKLTLPFSGTWNVWQGFDGKWTHKGNWKYAFDFVITDDDGNTYGNQGLTPEDFYCYRKPVLCTHSRTDCESSSHRYLITRSDRLIKSITGETWLSLKVKKVFLSKYLISHKILSV